MIEIKRNKKELRIILILIIVLLLLGTLSYIYQIDWRGDYDSLNNTKKQKVVLTEDSDKDGLLDWEEEIRGTDPNKKDTDDDGTEDGEEVKLNRDPLVPAPNDKITYTREKNEKTDSSKKDISATDMLAREIFTSYMALKQSGELGTKEQEKLIQKITDKNLNYEPNIKYYTLSDLNIIQDSSKKALQKYSNDLKQSLSSIPELRDDNFILKEAFDTESPKKLEEIKSNIVFYEKLVDDLVKIEIPLSLQNKHLDFINAFKKMIGNTNQMIQVFEDPIIGLVGAKEYLKTTQEIATASAEIGEYLIQNNIEF